VPLVPQVVRAQVVPEQAPGGGLRASRRGRRRFVSGVAVVAAGAAAEVGRPGHGHSGRITSSSGAAAADAPADVGHTVRCRRRRRRCRRCSRRR